MKYKYECGECYSKVTYEPDELDFPSGDIKTIVCACGATANLVEVIYDHLSHVPAKWNKYTYVCHTCDALHEVTMNPLNIPLDLDVTQFTCWCGGMAGQIGLEDATIPPMEEGEKVQTTLNEQIKNEYDLLYGNRITELENELDALRQNREYWLAEKGRIEGQVIELIKDSYENESVAEEILTTLAEIVDYNPVKEVEFTATIQFRGRIDVPMNELSSFDLTDALSEAYVDINDGNIVIDGYEIWECDEA